MEEIGENKWQSVNGLNCENKTNFVISLSIFTLKNNLREQYEKKRNNLSEEEIQKRNEKKLWNVGEKKEFPFLEEIIKARDGSDVFLFYNKGKLYSDFIATLIETEYYMFATLLSDDSFDVCVYKESHRYGAHFKNWDRQLREPKLKPLPYWYDKVALTFNIPSLYSVTSHSEFERFKDFGLDIDASTLLDSIKRFEEANISLYPQVLKSPKHKEYFEYAIKTTFDMSVGIMGYNARKRHKNRDTINSGKLFEKGLFPDGLPVI